jgi:hypothetical protein
MNRRLLSTAAAHRFIPELGMTDGLDICAATAARRAAGRPITHHLPEPVKGVINELRAVTRAAPGNGR